MAPISDDQYYLLERYYEDCGLARFNGSTATWSVGSEGQSPLDTTVNQLIPRGGISVNGIIGVATDSQGRAVLAINLDVGGTPGFGFLRFNGDSSLDTTIGTYGLALSALDGDDFQGYGVTVLSNGDYQVSGENTTTNQSETLIFQGTDRGINPIAISTNFSVPTMAAAMVISP